MRLNILIVTDCYYPSFGGIENHIHNLAKYLSNMGHNVLLLTHKAPNNYREMKKNYNIIRVPGNIIYKFGADIYFDFNRNKYISDIIDKFKPNIIHGQSFLSLLVIQTMLIACKKRIPVILTKHSEIFRKGKFNSFLNRNFNFLRFYDHYISGYMSVSKFILKEIAFSNKPYKIIYNGINKQDIMPIKTKEDICQQYSIDKNRIIIGFVSRLIKEKGVCDFIELIRSMNNVIGIIVGDGPERKGIENIIRKYKLENRIILTGSCEHREVGNYYQIFDYFFFPSRSEGLGIVLLEAMAFGVIPIAYNTGGIIEIIKNNKTGYIVKNIQQAIDIINLMEKEPIIKENIKRYLKTYINKFTWNNIAEKTEKFYYELLNN